MERKQVTYKQLKKGQEIREIRGENETRMLRAYSRGMSAAECTVYVKGRKRKRLW